MLAEFTLEDPEYIAEPLTHSRELIYSPHMALSPFDCDPEQTRRFLRGRPVDGRRNACDAAPGGQGSTAILDMTNYLRIM